MTSDEIEEMTDEGKDIPRVQKKLLLHALFFYDEECKKWTNGLFTPSDWNNVDIATFEDFRATKVPQLVSKGTTSQMSPTAGIVTSTQVQVFISSHRRDTKSYRKFNGTLKL